jgi:hypothetical protein
MRDVALPTPKCHTPPLNPHGIGSTSFEGELHTDKGCKLIRNEGGYHKYIFRTTGASSGVQLRVTPDDGIIYRDIY